MGQRSKGANPRDADEMAEHLLRIIEERPVVAIILAQHPNDHVTIHKGAVEVYWNLDPNSPGSITVGRPTPPPATAPAVELPLGGGVGRLQRPPFARCTLLRCGRRLFDGRCRERRPCARLLRCDNGPGTPPDELAASPRKVPAGGRRPAEDAPATARSRTPRRRKLPPEEGFPPAPYVPQEPTRADTDPTRPDRQAPGRSRCRRCSISAAIWDWVTW